MLDQSLRYVNYVTDLLAQCSLYKNTIYYFQYQKRMQYLIFFIYCFKTYIFFLVNSSNLMDTTKTHRITADFHCQFITKIVSEYDQEIPQSQTADYPMAPRGRATQPSGHTRKTN